MYSGYFALSGHSRVYFQGQHERTGVRAVRGAAPRLAFRCCPGPRYRHQRTGGIPARATPRLRRLRCTPAAASPVQRADRRARAARRRKRVPSSRARPRAAGRLACLPCLLQPSLRPRPGAHAAPLPTCISRGRGLAGGPRGTADVLRGRPEPRQPGLRAGAAAKQRDGHRAPQTGPPSAAALPVLPSLFPPRGARGAMAAPPPPVLLGLRDAAVPPGDGPPSQDTASKLGGSPDWRPSVRVAHPSCGICKAGLLHVVQIYCPLEGSLYHRVINVFACATKGCWGNSESWKVLRSQYLQVPRKEIQDCTWKQEQEWTQAAMDWCDGADDWGEDYEEASSERCGIFTSFPRERHCVAQFQRLCLGKNTGVFCDLAEEEQVKPSSCVPEFQPYYISVVDEEDYLSCDDVDHVQRLLKEYQQREDVDLEQLMSTGYSTDGSGEKYEKSGTEKRNRFFHKFMKRISFCQEQILRYSWDGQPLFITSPSADFQTMVPPCNNCKSKRIFEFQLMPAMVNMLKTRDNDMSIEFGTAVVYTCEKSCWTTNCSAPLEEYIFVQEDPDQQLFK
ncbi:programmed cell death protein 2-like [Candoia aspera]|uniref:programmed cell death protein 2-like n=1 Tax=Candoia aspera TaxID=51853 RepID=UPI002FD83F15